MRKPKKSMKKFPISFRERRLRDVKLAEAVPVEEKKCPATLPGPPGWWAKEPD